MTSELGSNWWYNQLVPALSVFSSTKVGQTSMDGTIHPDYKALNANQTNWRRILSYYEAHAEDRSRIYYTFRNTGLHIIIFVHEKIPLIEFKTLLYRFFRVMKTEDQVKNDKIDIRVVTRSRDAILIDDEQDANDDGAEYM